MVSHRGRLNLLSSAAAILSTGVFFFVRSSVYLRYGSPAGDERDFLEVLGRVHSDGLVATWSSGDFSPVFFLLAQPLAKLGADDLLALRAVGLCANLLLYGVVLWFARAHLEVRGLTFLSLILTLVSALSSRMYWQGINDSVLHCATVAFVVALWFGLAESSRVGGEKQWLVAASMALAVMLGTRSLTMLLLPGLMVFGWRHRRRMALVLVFGLAGGTVFHAPSLIAGNGLAGVDKDPSAEESWYELNHLTLQQIYEGTRREGTRAHWEELRQYKEEHPNVDLPTGLIESLLAEPTWTVREWARDSFRAFWDILLREIGFGMLVLLGLLLGKASIGVELSRRQADFAKLVLVSCLVTTAVFSFIVLLRVEGRWLFAHTVLAICFGHYAIQASGSRRKLLTRLSLITLVAMQAAYFLFVSNPLRSVLIRGVQSVIG